MQDLRAPADDAADAAVADVRDAIYSLRMALDRLDEVLGGLKLPTNLLGHQAFLSPSPSQVAAGGGDEAASEAAPSPTQITESASAADYEASTEPTMESPRDEPVPFDKPVAAWEAPQPEPERPANSPSGGWDQWTTSPSARDGGWPSAGAPEPAQAAAEPPVDADVREQVRRAVEQLKAELGSSIGDDEPALEFGDVEVEAPAVSAAEVASPEAETDEAPRAGEPGAEDEEEVRESVRRAVLEARAEIEPEETAAPVSDLRIPHYEALLDKNFLSPACIVIEDPEGRVELVRVYRTLARLERAATANLAKYSSHSVTVQMEERGLPTQEEIANAVSYAFERGCKIDIDGNRANVLLTGSDTRAA